MTPRLEQCFLEVIGEHTAGDPQREIRWTNLRQREIAQRMTAAGTPASRRIVRQLLKRHGFVRRVAQRSGDRSNSTPTASPRSNASPN